VTNEPELDEEVKSSNCITHIGITTISGVDSGLDKRGIDSDFDGGETDGDARQGWRPASVVSGPLLVAKTTGAGDGENSVIVDSAAARGGTSHRTGEGCEGRVGDEPTGDDGLSLVAGQTTRSVGEAAPTQSVGARGIEDCSSESGSTFPRREPCTADCDGASPEGGHRLGEEEEAELRELEAQLAIETVKRQARAGPMADAIRDLLASSPEAIELLKPFLPGYRPVSVVSGQLSVAEDLGVHREPLPRAP
jgi:hypothetical protein